MKAEFPLIIVDDHPVFRLGLHELIGGNPRFQIVGEASDGEAAVRLIEEMKPRIAILDIDMPRLNGLEMARTLRRMHSPVTIIFLTMYRAEDMFNAAMDLGVKAYVLKENAADDILVALERVAQGETFISPSLSEIGQRRSDRVQELLLSKPQIDELTSAERRILKLVAEDHTSKEIADLLGISVRTVENHRLNICYKLDVHGSHGLLKFAFDHKSYL
jgi:DNA-binding NarL/FixJ family response regulator